MLPVAGRWPSSSWWRWRPRRPIIGQAYLKRIAPRAPATAHFIDKLPMNYLYAGLIAAGLPGAQLVRSSATRWPAGYAMFKTLFNQGYPFSYDLDELGRYMAGYRRLTEHWRDFSASADQVEVRGLVADPGQTRRLISACGLAWDPACLAPHDNPAPAAPRAPCRCAVRSMSMPPNNGDGASGV